MQDFAKRRNDMIQKHLAARGLRDQPVLNAVRSVPREQFVPAELVESAYEDSPLPIAAGQTISQPYVVAVMAAALDLAPTDRVLEVGAGSGYAAAVLAHLVEHVYTIERHAELAEAAMATLARLGIDNVTVRHGDGTQGWPEEAPFDAIVVSAGSPEEIPPPLLEQLTIGGRLVIPAGSEHLQKLWQVIRIGADDYQRKDLGSVRFVPLIGKDGWQDSALPHGPLRSGRKTLPHLIERNCERFGAIEHADLGGLMQRIGDARLVLLGEASHGTAEFYDMRARITRQLIEHKGSNVVAVEADWPDAAAIHAHVRGASSQRVHDGRPFSRFPTWMWANESVAQFVSRLREHNAARERYGCLLPWRDDPAGYGRMARNDGFRACEDQVVAILRNLEQKRCEDPGWDGERLFDATQNARLVTSAERYYRAMYYGSRASWNLRDQHMFDTLEAVLQFRGRDSKAVVWAHNSHLGDARATEMGSQGEHNVGQLVRQTYGDRAYLIGFGTNHGTVAAASTWGGPMEVKNVQPSLPGSYERACHDSRVPRFMLPLRPGDGDEVRAALLEPRLERAIGVIYRPENERQSHYFQATLPEQFDEYIGFDQTRAVTPLSAAPARRPAQTFPFGV